MDILHKEQSFQDHPNQSTYIRFGRDSLKFKMDRKNNLTKPTELRIYEFSRLRNKYSSSQTNKGQGLLPWMTGPVTEILDCGHSYLIQAPNGRVYRRNRAHLKPICYDGTSFQDHSAKQEKKQPKSNSFQDHQPTKVKCVSFQTDTSYMDIQIHVV